MRDLINHKAYDFYRKCLDLKNFDFSHKQLCVCFDVKAINQLLSEINLHGSNMSRVHVILGLSKVVQLVSFAGLNGFAIKNLLNNPNQFQSPSHIPKVIMTLGYLAQENVFQNVSIVEPVHELFLRLDIDQLNQIDLTQFVIGFHRLQFFTTDNFQNNYTQNLLSLALSRIEKPEPSQQQIKLKTLLDNIGFKGVQLEACLNGYFVDVYLPNEKIIIELDGKQHYTSNGNLRFMDRQRDLFLEQAGFTVFRIQSENLRLDSFKSDFYAELSSITSNRHVLFVKKKEAVVTQSKKQHHKLTQ